MVLCAVRGCKMRTDANYQDGIGFYALPTVRINDPLHSQRSCKRRLSLWLAKLGKADSGKPLKVCTLLLSPHTYLNLDVLKNFYNSYRNP